MARLGAELARRGVRAGAWRPGPTSYNLTFHDASTVFVKMTRPGEPHDLLVAELNGALAASRAGLACTRPLLADPLELDDEQGQTRLVTVWHYEAAACGPALPDRVRDVLGLIVAMRALDGVAPLATRPHTLDLYLSNIARRLDGRADTFSQSLRRRVQGATARVETLTRGTAAVRQGWIHGDPTLLNALWRTDGTAMLVDFEQHALGPVEWEVATLMRSCFVHTPRYAPEARLAAARIVAKEAPALLAGLNWALVEAYVAFRNASAQAALHAFGHDPVQFALSKILDGLLDAGQVFGPDTRSAPAIAA